MSNLYHDNTITVAELTEKTGEQVNRCRASLNNRRILHRREAFGGALRGREHCRFL